MFEWFKRRSAISFSSRVPSPERGREPPISYAQVRNLFERLNRPNPPPCDHTLRETVEFLRENSLPVEPTIAWLRANGGYCDCEVIFNVTNEWGEKVGWIPAAEEES